MIDYLGQQERQMMGEALRGNPSGTVASGGTTAMTPSGSMQAARQQNMDSWNQRQQQLAQQGSDMSSGAGDLGKWLGKDNGYGQSNGAALWDKASSLFGNFGSSGGAGIGNAAQQYGPEVAKMGGNVTSPGWGDSISSFFGGGAGGSAGGAGGSAGAAGGAGLGTLAATGAALLGAGIGADNLLNKNDDKWYSANKINDYGTVGIGGKDVGFRGGDLMNGLNPVTWAKDPKKGATGLFNFFTGGVFD